MDNKINEEIELFYDNKVERSSLPTIPSDWIGENQKGMNIKSHSCFAADEVSSAAQKAVRRGYSLEAIQWFLELFWSSPHRRTNIWNRALVMSVEDIGPADPLLILKILNLRSKYLKNSKITNIDVIDNSLEIATAAILLAQSKKTRVNDWGIHLYMLNHKSETAPEVLKQEFKSSLIKKSCKDALFWAGQLISSEIKVGGRKQDKAEILIWEALLEVSIIDLTTKDVSDNTGKKNDNFIGLPNNKMMSPYVTELMNLAFESNWKWNEKSYLLISHLIHLICYDNLPTIGSTTKTFTSDDKFKINFNDSEWKGNLKDIVLIFRNRQLLFGVPDYAIDKHTASGIRLGRDITHFANEGGKLNNKDPKWEQLDDFYFHILFNNNVDVEI